MWIFACGMFRSGSTLQYQLVSEMVERAGLGRRLPWRDPEDFADFAPDLDDADDMLVFKTHVAKHAMRVRMADGRAKAVGVHRDLRDVAVSGARKAGVEPTPGWCRELVTGLMACAEGWAKAGGVLELAYADLVADPAACCLRMARHLGVPLTPGQASELAAAFAPDRQRERIERAVRDGRMRPARPGGRLRHMERELLHPDHLAGGVIGGWREHLPAASIEVIESIGGAWLADRGYELVTVAAA